MIKPSLRKYEKVFFNYKNFDNTNKINVDLINIKILILTFFG